MKRRIWWAWFLGVCLAVSGCAGLGDDVVASLEDAAVAGTAAAADGALTEGLVEMEGGDGDWSAVGVTAAIAAALAFGGGLLRRRAKRAAEAEDE